MSLGASNAVDSMFNGSLTGLREQTVYTPERVLAPVRELFGGPIAHDPCWAPGSLTNPTGRVEIPWAEIWAKASWLAPEGLHDQVLDLLFCRVRSKEVSPAVRKAKKELEGKLRALYGALSGHRVPWIDGTFVNPVYGDKGPYAILGTFEDFCAAFAQNDVESVMLCPVRTHRKWWRRDVLFTADAVTYLNPLKFEGFAQTFPAPLCLAYRGPRADKAKQVFAPLGDTDVRCK